MVWVMSPVRNRPMDLLNATDLVSEELMMGTEIPGGGDGGSGGGGI